MKHKRIAGFTLIELMIVVAILGVLSSIAIVGYSNYVIRAQVSESISISNSIKLKIAEHYQHNGSMPQNNAALDLLAANTFTGAYTTSVEINQGAVHITLGNNVHPKLKNKILSIRPAVGTSPNTASMLWICGNSPVPSGLTASGSNLTTISSEYLPTICRDY
ncbi:Tfp pilus assembly protein, major pilin PilA [Oleiphilus messinensis]|uniref:Tfp pilus assembly protein, major pilin PilA n=1 Tax=Oleiphilus messinensis TaxID=141451 RepID=A0A1Y0I8D2_9GAMM|nr:pilin [Oleiphilus messinensis]ARU56026.1 Tfp pilus assembly protein, major pilin PilA [Oleiphilus messinensis]